jgi:MFS family permease
MQSVTRAPLRRAFRAFRNPNYRLFWFGQLVSLTGTWMQSVAQAWLVLRLTGSPLALGTVTLVQTTPFLLFSLFGGVIADRVRKRRLLLVTQTVMALDALTLATLTVSGRITLPLIYVLVGLMGLANAVDNPTRQAFVSEMVGPDDLPNAVALNSTLFNAARLIGPALGGVTIAAVGVAGCFSLNALSFLAVIGGLLRMRPERFFTAPRPARGHVLRQIGEGLRYAVRTPDVALVVLLMAVIGTFGYNFQVIMPLLARFVLHTGPAGFGALTSAVAAGSLIGSLAIAYTGRARWQTLLMGAAGFSVCLLAVALSHVWLVSMALLAALGLCSIVFTATANTRLQLTTPPHLRGRVMSIYSLLFMGSTPVGSLIIGTLAERLGVQPAVAGAAAACGVGVLASLAYARRVRHRLTPDAALTPAPPRARSAYAGGGVGRVSGP